MGYLWVLGSLEGVILETRIYRSEPIIHSFHIRTTQMAIVPLQHLSQRIWEGPERVPEWSISGYLWV